MPSFQFDESAQRTRKISSTLSNIDRWIIACSFGVVTNKRESQLVQIIIIVISLIAIVFLQINASGTSLSQPVSDELINAEQPIGSLPE